MLIAVAFAGVLAAGNGDTLVAAGHEVRLTGAQDGLYDRADYVVECVLVIERGKTMKFAPGSVIRLDKYGEVRVHGRLECAGTPDENIVFTSAAAGGKGRPAPFGWNGIVLEDSGASVALENTRVSNSTFGVKVDSRKASVTLKDVWFSDNGSSNIALGDSIVPAPQNQAFSFVYPRPQSEENAALARSLAGQAQDLEPQLSIKRVRIRNTEESWRTPVRLSLAGLTIIGAGFAIAGQAVAYSAQREYEGISSPDQDRFSDVKNRRNGAITARNIGIPLTLIGGIDLVFTFVF